MHIYVRLEFCPQTQSAFTNDAAHLSPCSESKGQQLERELEEKSALVSRLEGVDREVSVLRQQLSDIQSQLEATAKTLAKEQGKNRSAAQHKQVRVCRVPLSTSRYVSVECRSAQAGTCL